MKWTVLRFIVSLVIVVGFALGTFDPQTVNINVGEGDLYSYFEAYRFAGRYDLTHYLSDWDFEPAFLTYCWLMNAFSLPFSAFLNVHRVSAKGKEIRAL